MSMTFVEKHRFAGSHTEKTLLKIAWEGELFGVGLFETWTEMFPEHAKELTACSTMEWFNVHYIESFGHDAGVVVTLERAERLGREGGSYDLFAHENAMRDWLKSEVDGKSDGAEKVFGYLERHGISREEAVTPRKRREDVGGDKQHLVLAFFDREAAADEAAEALKNWEKASDYMKVDAIGVVAKDEDGKVKEHKLGKRAGKKGMGIGVALGVIAAIPTGGLSLIGSVAGGVVGGGVIGRFFHKGLKMTDEDVTRVGRELDAGYAAVGVLTWDFETEAVADKLKELGGASETHEVAEVPAEEQ